MLGPNYQVLRYRKCRSRIILGLKTLSSGFEPNISAVAWITKDIQRLRPLYRSYKPTIEGYEPMLP